METEVVGREAELEEIERWLDGGRPSALLIEGEAGIGKTTLWRAGVEQAHTRGAIVLTCAPSFAESEIGFAALGDLLYGHEPAIQELPPPQRRALEGALLLREPERAPEGRALALGFLGVLTRLASETPVLVAVDDIQWLDAASRGVLTFAARRLEGRDIGFLVARRTGDGDQTVPVELDAAFPSGGLEVCMLGPLSLGALGRVVRQQTGLRLRRPELLRLEALSGGNPFFAVELAPTLTGASTERRPLPTSLSAAVQGRLAELGEDTLEALLVAAISTSPTLAEIEQVTGEPDAWVILAPARDAGVVTNDPDVAFVHPLYAAAALERASPKRRAEVHRLLAALADSPERRALHLAASTQDADESVATEIEAGAHSAMLRGAPEVGSELAARARALTLDNGDASRRRGLLEAECLYAAGDLERGRGLLAALADDAPRGPARAEILFRLARSPHNFDDAVELCERGLAEAVDDPALASEIARALAENLFLAGDGERAITEARRAIDLGSVSGVELCEWHARSTLAIMQGARGAGWDLDTLRRAADLELAASERPVVGGAAESLCQALTYNYLLDEALERVAELSERATKTRDARAEASFLALQCTLECWFDRLHAARDTAKRCLEAKEAIGWEQGYGETLGMLASIDALLGREDEAREEAERAVSIARAGSDQLGVMRHHQALSTLELGLENWEAAAEHVEAALAAQATMLSESNVFGFLSSGVEAHAACGNLERADELATRLEADAARNPTAPLQFAAWQTRGVVQAAAGDLEGAMQSLQLAVAAMESLPVKLEPARALLHLGRAQRRARRLAEARVTLNRALELFDDIGASLLAGQTRRELARIPGRRAQDPDELTETERRIADLVAEGRTNKEVAAALSLTVKTVEVTLTRVYRKLGVRSRSELARRSTDFAKQPAKQ